jgi:GMP synthase-like glutamine amidotransferase
MSRVVVLRHHVEDDAGLIGAALERRGFALETLLVDERHRAPTTLAADVAVVLGSNCSVYDPEARAAWFEGELELLARLDRAGVAILGICFGAQALCELFGGRVVPAERGEVGWQLIEVEAGVALSAGPWFEYHQDRCELPAGAIRWARSADAVQAFVIGRHLGVQFHPEIDGDQLARWFAGASAEPRAHDEHEAALLAETRRESPAAAVRAAGLVNLFLAHAGLA